MVTEYKVIPTLGNTYVFTRKKHSRGDILNEFSEKLRVIANLGKNSNNHLYELRVEKIE